MRYDDCEAADNLGSMKLASFKQILDVQTLTRYQKATLERVGVELPIEYLKRSRVFALQDTETGELLGGFTFAFQGPLRCLSQIPKEQQDALPVDLDRCFEINGLWLNNKKAPKSSRLDLYLKAMKEALRLMALGKTKYVYAYSAHNTKLRAFYQNFNSTKLYEGPVAMLPGMDKPSEEVVEMGCMKRLPLTVARNPGFLMERAVKGQMQRFAWLS